MVVGAGTLPAGLWFDIHRHPQHQIAWAARGVIAVETAHGRWVLPPTRALWIPGDLAHRTGTVGGADMRGIFLEPPRTPVAFAAPTMLRVSRLLHELFDHLTATPRGAQALIPTHADTTDPGPRARAEAVVFDLLEPVEVVPIGATMPRDPRATTVAETLLRTPSDPRTLAEFASETATSTRTLARLFRAETGLGFGAWRTQIRLAASLPLLAEGLPVARIAPRVGYASASAYVAAFRRAVGMSPVRYFAR
ncbi:helix-turn-helix transcriptional regulator [Nocardia sp. NEAU-351]|uniref:HTH-type transcriptional regulator RipA n=2 Tax=Nocardia bovistercoris TaxID=2785916 RepID=A0A931I839_9NOCA|nr:helix-turn-helix transcriptional regulator [Nocardia bovistercoris]MBH0775120.1 helix-turn-helix transcriptional regulator [Nocardia bovistercoris]